MDLSLIQMMHLVPFGLLRRMAGINPLIVNYHVVSDKRLPHIINLYAYRDIQTFKEDLDFFAGHYRPVSIFDVLDHLRGRIRLPNNSFLLTFDDGFCEIYDNVAPILLEKGIPATFFLTRDFIDNNVLGYDSKKSLIIDKILSGHPIPEKLKGMTDFKTAEDLTSLVFNVSYSNRLWLDEIAGEMELDFSGYLKHVSPYLTSDQISKLLGQGFAIGSHSLDHARFRELTLDEQLLQVKSSTDYLCEKFSLQYRVFAFPYSDISISRDFFRKIEGSIDATFGTQGLLTDSIPSNFQRISVEKFPYPACPITKFYYFRRTIHRLIKKELIIRK